MKNDFIYKQSKITTNKPTANPNTTNMLSAYEIRKGPTNPT
jgi:hypothetical protein